MIWDNFSTMHRGGEYDDVASARDMRRTTVMAWPPPPVVLDPRFSDRFDPAQFEAMVRAVGLKPQARQPASGLRQQPLSSSD